MKKFIFSLFISLITMTAFAQKDVTKFLGIPVDGTKSDMIQKLKAKGFKSSYSDKEILEGEFNGEQVSIHIATNGNKVYRIMVADQTHRDETDIRIRFNNLCNQFETNNKYGFLHKNNRISESEDISYEILLHKKRYEAVYYQTPENIDSATVSTNLINHLSQKYTVEQIANPTPEMKAEAENFIESYLFGLFTKKSVWFMISELYGQYYICMYYDNEYNRANGQDL